MEEYIQDGIDWTQVDFEDNQECLNLFEKRPLGLLSLLDEESTFPKATDLTFANKLRQHLKANSCFKAERGGAFSVRHYAGEVLYDTSGFLEKNRDPLHSDSVQLLSSCSCQLPQLFASNLVNQPSKPRSPLWRRSVADSQKRSVGTKFKRLEGTTPHFIRCIMPNSKQLPGMYENDLVLQQLRCCGVLEIVRISRSGYPTRMTHQQFARRYGFLLSENVATRDPLSISVAILQQFSVRPDMYQVGYTKLFFRTGQIGSLEETRQRTLQGILGIQKYFRGRQARHYVQELKKAITMLQSFVRGETARREFEHLLFVVHPSVLAELQRRVLKAEAALKQKEDENVTLQQQLKHYETRWVEYEAKMKSMEEMWQKQMTSLQCGSTPLNTPLLMQKSLTTAKTSIVADNPVSPTVRLLDASPVPQYYDSEDVMSETHSPDMALGKASTRTSDAGMGRDCESGYNAVGRLAREFEQRKQVFDDDAGFLIEVKTGQSTSNMNPDEELRKLKLRFTAWKRDYKVRLRETKVALQKLGNSESDKTKKKWWGKRAIKGT
ncbi:hypothetical protein ACLOJK_015187 [Asimina triloba]